MEGKRGRVGGGGGRLREEEGGNFGCDIKSKK